MRTLAAPRWPHRTFATLAASVLLFALAIARPAPSFAQDAAAFAQQRFARALTMYHSRQYENALAEFQASMALYASPNSRLFIARCFRGLNRTVEAYAEYTRAVAEAAQLAANDRRYAATRDSARRELAAIEGRIGRVTVTAPGLPAGAHITLAGRELPAPALGLPAPVAPGSVLLVAEAPSYQRLQITLNVRPGSSHAREVRLTLLPGAVSATSASAATPSVSTTASGAGAITLAGENMVANGGVANGGVANAGATGATASAATASNTTGDSVPAAAPSNVAASAPSAGGAARAATQDHAGSIDRGVMAPTGRGPVLIGGAIAAGVGAVMLGGGVAFYVAADSQFRRLEQCTTGGAECPSAPGAERAAGRTLEGLQNVGLVGGGIFLAGGIALLTTGLLMPRPVVRLGVTNTGLSVEGRF